MLTARFYPYLLIFNEPGGTSRGVMTERKVWYITLYDKETTVCGIGECAPLPGLSCDDMVHNLQDKTVLNKYIWKY